VRVRVKEGHTLAGATGEVIIREDTDGAPLTATWFVRLDGEVAPRWIRREMLEEEPVYPKVGERVAIGEGHHAGSVGSVVQVDRDDAAILMQLDQRTDPLWFNLEDLLQGDAVAAIEREQKAHAALKAEIERDVDVWQRLADAQKTNERLRIAPGWADAGRIGRRIAPDVEVNGTAYVPLVWEDTGGFPAFVLKCTLAPAVTAATVPPKSKNERLRGMVYLHRRIGDHHRAFLLMQAGAVLTPAQYDEACRRINAWSQLERLYQRLCDDIALTVPSVREELGRIVKGGA
jgi:hypothetical protein